MADQTQKQKATEEKADASDASVKDLSKKGDELKEDLDELMEEIDNVLEENAEEFVKAFVQRGGE